MINAMIEKFVEESDDDTRLPSSSEEVKVILKRMINVGYITKREYEEYTSE